MADPAAEYLQRRVVIDTQGPLLYIGTLTAVDGRYYHLADADVHDRHDGHSTKEVYISNAALLERAGSRNVNRRTVLVERAVVASISRLADVMLEAEDEDADDRIADAGESRPRVGGR